ncbi:MAG: RNA 2',3'-cyclic phosphodiesterase [Bacteroidales bacterium]|nr:RNA 2',3'-cyclic phosphodiesterase [Bacteroidales bacterium]
MKRLFAAIHIVPDEHFLELYTDLRKRLKRENIRWVEPGNLHITLKFFGETQAEKTALIQAALKKAALKFSTFHLILKKTAIFGSSYQPRVIWFGTEENKQILFLSNEILSKLDSAVFLRDRQNFVPHLTLGRMRGVKYNKDFQRIIASFAEVFVQEVKISEFALFESKLYPGGPVYTVIEKYSLK